MAEVIDGILIREVETKNIMTKSSLPVGGYSVNPYVGCTHACKYCYASFMKRFTGHKEEWGTFLGQIISSDSFTKTPTGQILGFNILESFSACPGVI